VGALDVVILGHYVWCGTNMQCAHKRACKSSPKVSVAYDFKLCNDTDYFTC